MADKKTDNQEENRLISTIEAFEQFSWMLHFLVLALYFDAVAILLGKETIVNWNLAFIEDVYINHLGVLIMALLGLSVSVSLLLPLLEAVISHAIWAIWIKFLEQEKSKFHGYVSLRELEDEADMQQSQYLLAKANEQKKEHQAQYMEARQLGSRAFRTLVLLGLNKYVSIQSPTMLTTSIYFLPANLVGNVMLWVVTPILFYLCLQAWCKSPWPREAIRYKPLYEKLGQQKKL